MAELLETAEVDAWVAAQSRWRRDGDVLRCSVECASFPAAIEFVRRVADLAEARDHHPDIDIRWRTVHLALSTHSAGGLTAKDLDLAGAISETAPPQT